MEWKDLTIKQAQKVYALNNTITDEITSFEAQVQALSYLTDIPEDVINSWTMSELNQHMAKIAFMRQPLVQGEPVQKFKVKGRRYFLSYDMTDVSYGQYNEVMEFSKGEDYIVNNLHKIMASIVQPVNWLNQKLKKDHRQVAEDMLEAPFILAHSCAVFFWKVYTAFLKITQEYLESELQAKGMMTKEAKETVQVLLKVMDGSTPQKSYQTL